MDGICFSLSIVWSRCFSISFNSSVNAMVVCKAQGFIMKLQFKHTRYGPDVLHRELFRFSRIMNSGTCNKLPDMFTLDCDTWHFVEGGGRLFKLISYEFAAWSDLTRFRYFNFSSVALHVCVCLCFFLCLILSFLLCFSARCSGKARLVMETCTRAMV